MVHSFKFGGQRVAYDSVSGVVLPLSELAFKMLDYIELPMPKDCPSALRYDLAKYDSAAISDTYDELYALYRAGKLFAEAAVEQPAENVVGAILTVGAHRVTHKEPALLTPAKALADAGEATSLAILPAETAEEALSEEELPALLKEMEKLAKEQAKREKGEGGTPFTAFGECTPRSHPEAGCVGCWAKRLCALSAPHGVMCELERKRIECTMMVDIASQKETTREN